MSIVEIPYPERIDQREAHFMANFFGFGGYQAIEDSLCSSPFYSGYSGRALLQRQSNELLDEGIDRYLSEKQDNPKFGATLASITSPLNGRIHFALMRVLGAEFLRDSGLLANNLALLQPFLDRQLSIMAVDKDLDVTKSGFNRKGLRDELFCIPDLTIIDKTGQIVEAYEVLSQAKDLGQEAHRARLIRQTLKIPFGRNMLNQAVLKHMEMTRNGQVEGTFQTHVNVIYLRERDHLDSSSTNPFDQAYGCGLSEINSTQAAAVSLLAERVAKDQPWQEYYRFDRLLEGR